MSDRLLPAHTTMLHSIEAMTELYAAKIKEEAIRIVGADKKLSGFSMSMGMTCFYDRKKNSIDREYNPVPLSEDATALLAMCNDYQQYFGSPGITVWK